MVDFDINPKRIAELQAGQGHTLECLYEQLKSANHLAQQLTAQQLGSSTGGLKRALSSVTQEMVISI